MSQIVTKISVVITLETKDDVSACVEILAYPSFCFVQNKPSTFDFTCFLQ